MDFGSAYEGNEGSRGSGYIGVAIGVILGLVALGGDVYSLLGHGTRD
ncbi:hypothetical protein An02g10510 [Aspergillus niger]|uniref:Uncharacterized protein n=2 Tax=Aspergillus niger TaxID=5061 RepID=A5AAF8_ASPNC|nr:hypothetical protein An02g10510 [Aspergillus niger]CAK44400.1 hypothetical protein An02g10510 [Aspergillus niger]